MIPRRVRNAFGSQVLMSALQRGVHTTPTEREATTGNRGRARSCFLALSREKMMMRLAFPGPRLNRSDGGHGDKQP